MKKQFLILFLVFLLFSSFAFALQGVGGTFTVNLMTELEANQTDESAPYNFTASMFAYPTGKSIYLGDNVFVLGAESSHLSDLIEPQFENITVEPRLAYQNQKLNVTADVYDNGVISEYWVNITKPDLSSVRNTSAVPLTVTTSELGTYQIKFYASDTNSNLGYTENYQIKVTQPQMFKLNITQNLTQDYTTLLYYNSLFQRTNQSNSSIQLYMPSELYTIHVTPDSNDQTVFFSNHNISKNSVINLTLDEQSNVFGYSHVYSSYTDSTETLSQLRLSYSSSLDEDHLGVYICEDWDFAGRSCTGTWNSTDISYQDKIFNYIYMRDSYLLNNASYAIKQELFCGDSMCSAGENCTSCFVDCGSCPVAPSDPDDSSGSSSSPSGTDSYNPYIPTTIKTTSEPIKQIVEDDVYYEYDIISEEEGFSVELDESESSLIGLDVDVSKDLTNVKLVVATLIEQELENFGIPDIKNSNSDVKETYDYIMITHDNLDNADIVKSNFKFSVSRDWIKRNDATTDDIEIYKFIEGVWVKQIISYDESFSTSTHAIYILENDGLSLFSIVVRKVIEETIIPLDDYLDGLEGIADDLGSRDFSSIGFIIAIMMGVGVVLGAVGYGGYNRMVAQSKVAAKTSVEVVKIDSGLTDLWNKGIHYPDDMSSSLKKFGLDSDLVDNRSHEFYGSFLKNNGLTAFTQDIILTTAKQLNTKYHLSYEEIYAIMSSVEVPQKLLVEIAKIHEQNVLLSDPEVIAQMSSVDIFVDFIRKMDFSPEYMRSYLKSKGFSKKLTDAILIKLDGKV